MISVMMIKEDIEDIIWRDYQGICSEEEKLSLQEWIEASEKNRLVFEQIRSIIESGELVKGYDVLNEQSFGKGDEADKTSFHSSVCVVTLCCWNSSALDTRCHSLLFYGS